MSHARETIWISGLLCLSLAVTTARAQSDAAVVPAPDSATPSPDSASAEAGKKGGLFGKVKNLAGNKVVQSVAKTAACTMVPGGQVIAGAIDAASSKSVGEAAAGAAGGGQTCMPGVGGIGGGAAGLAGSMSGDVAAPGVGALPPGAMPEDAMGFGAMPAMPAPAEIAACMGMTEEEYLDVTDPTRGEARALTKAEAKRQSTLARKLDLRRYQACMMQQHSK